MLWLCFSWKSLDTAGIKLPPSLRYLQNSATLFLVILLCFILEYILLSEKKILMWEPKC